MLGSPSAPERVPLGHDDQELERVYASIRGMDNLASRAAAAIRGAIDDVLRGERTGRYSIERLSRQEKAHIGTQVEIALVQEFFRIEGKKLDTLVDGIEVDIKNTIGDNWMIPHEAVDELCLLTLIDEQSRTYSLGLVRAFDDLLNKPNQDGKRSFSTKGKATIRWIANKAYLPVSIFLQIPDATRDTIWRHKSGQARVNELFRQVQRVPILRSDLVALAKQQDPAKRARDAKKWLKKEGLTVLCGRYRKEAEKAKARGIDLKPYEWVSVTL
jgi:Restriction endonuclease NaeI